MSKRKRYSPEYKRELVEVVRRSQSSCRRSPGNVAFLKGAAAYFAKQSPSGTR
jgi:hypothetical protein